ncbi:hypothetical protein SAMN04488107_2949 [Geodermatophilus saharensis]|uniref:Uncharacterized protein n=1 Tax=Geodermatophilus saharensis TaxID=1137994 RepID=A0A239FDN5_9ACTN|nr:hypothetical protein [Geodermatophilus saharensis]SNS54413.1 hypothetical protein SAMN04488107_2949 [Geodermatophilus saharensis]
MSRSETRRAADTTAHQAAYPKPQATPEPRITFTASGVPVTVLNEVPPSVRRAVAAAETHAAAYALGQRYVGMADGEAAERLCTDRSVSVLYGGASSTGVARPI